MSLKKKILSFIYNKFTDETELLAIGKLLSNQQYSLNFEFINDYEFKIFSQFGDDGIIQYLIKNIKIKNEVFIEFGVENYLESNTRFLMMNNNWSGLIMDGDQYNVESIKTRKWYWKYDLTFWNEFITKENINKILFKYNQRDIGLLHIDIDGNDYHIIDAIDLDFLNPSIIIMEYNGRFGIDRPITIPYDPSFYKTKAHYSNMYFGASLKALEILLNQKGYKLVGGNTNGMNAYFVKQSLLNDKIKQVSLDQAYFPIKSRDARDEKHQLTYNKNDIEKIRNMPVLNIETGQIEAF